MAELPISVTLPVNSVSSKASIRIVALSPTEIDGTSVSSTCTTTSITERSEIVSTRLPGLFIVPMMTVSPSSTFRRVTLPSMGARKIVLESCSSASSTDARHCATPCCEEDSVARATSTRVRASSTCSPLTSTESRALRLSSRSRSRWACRRLASCCVCWASA